jgi:hypothetical protein
MTFDPDSIYANQHGRLSETQWRLVRREMARWLINGMFTMAIGLLVVFALPAWLPFVFWLPVALTAFYMAFRGYDCCRDSLDRRIAAATGTFTAHSIERGSSSGGRTLVLLRGRRFWVPTRALDELRSPAMTIYFTPRALIVVNVEPAEPVPSRPRAG